jgi:hypothetical protein
VESDPLTDQAIARIRSKVRKRILDFAVGMDNFFADSGRKSHAASKRIGVGVYYFEDD